MNHSTQAFLTNLCDGCTYYRQDSNGQWRCTAMDNDPCHPEGAII